MKEFVVWKRVFRDWKYVLLLLVVGILFYFLNGFMFALPELKNFYLIGGFSEVIKKSLLVAFNLKNNVVAFTHYGIILMSLLFGVFISLLVYRFDSMKGMGGKKVGAIGSVGAFLGIAAPGCAACGAGLIGLLGLSSAFFVLPFEGKEVISLGVILLLFSVFSLSRKLYNPVCRINLNTYNVKGGSD